MSKNEPAVLLREGIPDLNFSIYPNPAHGYLNIVLEMEEEAHITVLNTPGQIIISEKINSIDKTIQINVNELPAGNYVIKIQTDEMEGHQIFEVIK